MKNVIYWLLVVVFVINLNASNVLLADEQENSLNLTQQEKLYLKDKNFLTIANLGTFPPFNFYDHGQPQGYTVDYMRLMAKYMDVDVKFISNESWATYLSMLKDGSLDIIPHLAVTKEREKYAMFTSFNHIEHTTGMAITKDSNIKSMADLKDKIIATTNKSFLHIYLKNNFPEHTLLLVDSTAQAIEALSLGQADAAIGSLPALTYYIQKNWLSNVKTATISGLGITTKTALPMAVRKDNEVLLSILEKVHLAIPHNEEAKLKQKWMNIPSIKTISNNLTDEELEYLHKKKKIKMCVLPDWLPFEQIDKNGNHKGIGADILKIVSKYINTPFELVKTKTWAESLQNIRDRKCDILPVAMEVPSRRDAMNFTHPYVNEPYVIATKLDKLFVKDSHALKGKKVGVVKSYAILEVIKQKAPEVEIVNVENTKEGLERVSNGELFGYIDTMPTIGYGIQKYSMLDLKIAGKLDFDIKLSIASRNDEPILNTIMQKALDTISDEQRRTIVGKWVEIKVAQDFDYTLLWQISGVFLLIVLGVLYKNRTVVKLHREIAAQQKMVDKYVLILSTDTDGIMTEVNEAYCKAIGYTKEELLGQKHADMIRIDAGDSIYEEIWNTIIEDKLWFGEVKNYKKDSSNIWFSVNIEPIFKKKIKIGYRAICEDITDKKRIEVLSVTDKLTGLYNRLKLDELLLVKVEEFKRYHTQFSIIILDIDDFKNVNDIFGHDIGDYILAEMSQILKDNIRTTDVIGRWGGEEFVIICSNTNKQESYILAEKLRKIIEDKKFEKVGTITITLGVAQFENDDTISSIFKRADEVLYEAKETGKNKVMVAS